MFLYVNYLLKIIFTYEKSILRCRYCYFHNLLHLKEYLKKKKKKASQFYSYVPAVKLGSLRDTKRIKTYFWYFYFWTGEPRRAFKFPLDQGKFYWTPSPLLCAFIFCVEISHALPSQLFLPKRLGEGLLKFSF